MMRFRWKVWLIAVLFSCVSFSSAAVQAGGSAEKQKVILDTDIGDDIDDSFALALVLASPDLELLGVTTAWGDTQVRARLVERMLCETGMDNIPIAAGASTENKVALDHSPWARAFWKPVRHYGPAVDFILDQIRKYPGQITLIAIAPMTNVGDLI